MWEAQEHRKAARPAELRRRAESLEAAPASRTPGLPVPPSHHTRRATRELLPRTPEAQVGETQVTLPPLLAKYEACHGCHRQPAGIEQGC